MVRCDQSRDPGHGDENQRGHQISLQIASSRNQYNTQFDSAQFLVAAVMGSQQGIKSEKRVPTRDKGSARAKNTLFDKPGRWWYNAPAMNANLSIGAPTQILVR
jgi:hypothetical protein